MAWNVGSKTIAVLFVVEEVVVLEDFGLLFDAVGIGVWGEAACVGERAGCFGSECASDAVDDETSQDWEEFECVSAPSRGKV